MKSKRTLLAVIAAIALIGGANAQVEIPLFAAGGAVLPDGTILTVGDFAIGTIAGADQGAVPCWTGSVCPGDIDSDGQVGLTDLTILLSNFGTPGGANAGDGDFDGDGDVDLSDLTVLLSVFGTTC